MLPHPIHTAIWDWHYHDSARKSWPERRCDSCIVWESPLKRSSLQCPIIQANGTCRDGGRSPGAPVPPWESLLLCCNFLGKVPEHKSFFFFIQPLERKQKAQIKLRRMCKGGNDLKVITSGVSNPSTSSFKVFSSHRLSLGRETVQWHSFCRYRAAQPPP